MDKINCLNVSIQIVIIDDDVYRINLIRETKQYRITGEKDNIEWYVILHACTTYIEFGAKSKIKRVSAENQQFTDMVCGLEFS